MRVIDPGHEYILDGVGDAPPQRRASCTAILTERHENPDEFSS